MPERYKDILVDNGYTPAQYNYKFWGGTKGKVLASQEFIDSMGVGGTICDYLAFGFNLVYMLPSDAITLLYPPVYPEILAIYQYYSILPNSISTLALFAWTAQGIANGENQFLFHASDKNLAFSISISQDTAVSTITNIAGWSVLRDPNIATPVDGAVALYDTYRFGYIPSLVNISLSLNSSSGWQIYLGK